MFALGKMPANARTEVFSRIEAPYEMTGVWAGQGVCGRGGGADEHRCAERATQNA